MNTKWSLILALTIVTMTVPPGVGSQLILGCPSSHSACHKRCVMDGCESGRCKVYHNHPSSMKSKVEDYDLCFCHGCWRAWGVWDKLIQNKDGKNIPSGGKQ